MYVYIYIYICIYIYIYNVNNNDNNDYYYVIILDNIHIILYHTILYYTTLPRRRGRPGPPRLWELKDVVFEDVFDDNIFLPTTI